MKRLAALVSAFFFLSCGTAYAEGFGLYEYSARGVALSGSTVARSPDPSAVATNPALITKLKGAKMQAGFSAISPLGKIETTSPSGQRETTTLKPATWVIPNIYYTQQLNDDWYFGIGEFSRFGLGIEYSEKWPGRYNVYGVSLQTASLNPNIAWAATDKLSLAAGVEVMYLTLDLKKKSPIGPAQYDNPNAMQLDADIRDADSVGFGANLAAHYQFNDQWAAGILYRSQVEHKAEGTNYIRRDNTSGIPGSALTALGVPQNGEHDAHGTVVLPDSIAGGIAWTPTPELSFEVGAIWTKWSNFRSLRIYTDGLGVSESRKDWRNTWRLNFGAEWKALDWLTLRAGYAFDQSPMTSQYADYLVPTANRNIYSAGFGVRLDEWTFDLAYAFIDPISRSYHRDAQHHVLTSKTGTSRTDIISLSLTYEF